MLVLTRRINETIRIGDDIVVKVLGIEGGKVRIGVLAPDAVPVDREEIYARKEQERRRAAPERSRAARD